MFLSFLATPTVPYCSSSPTDGDNVDLLTRAVPRAVGADEARVHRGASSFTGVADGSPRKGSLQLSQVPKTLSWKAEVNLKN